MWQEVTKKNISTYFFIGLYYKDFPTEINMYLDSVLIALSPESQQHEHHSIKDQSL